jgi:hypothetical protein
VLVDSCQGTFSSAEAGMKKKHNSKDFTLTCFESDG